VKGRQPFSKDVRAGDRARGSSARQPPFRLGLGGPLTLHRSRRHCRSFAGNCAHCRFRRLFRIEFTLGCSRCIRRAHQVRGLQPCFGTGHIGSQTGLHTEGRLRRLRSTRALMSSLLVAAQAAAAAAAAAAASSSARVALETAMCELDLDLGCDCCHRDRCGRPSSQSHQKSEQVGC